MREYNRDINIEEIAELLCGLRDVVILEIGANAGEDTQAFLDNIPDCRVICYEPDPRPLARLRKRFNGNPRVAVRGYAIGAVNGDVTFYASHGDIRGSKHCHNHDWDLSGSIRRPVHHLARSPEITFSEIKIRCCRLDDCLVGQIDFAWIDVQGAQREVIEGGRETLDCIPWIYCECHKAPEYDGETRPEELHALLPRHRPIARYGENYLYQMTYE